MAHPARTAARLRLHAGLLDLLKLAGPVMLARLGIMGMGLTDTVVVGRFSATELGYNALGWAPTSVMLVTSVGLLTGVQVLTAQAIGEGRPERCGAVLRRGLRYGLLVGLSVSALLLLLGPWLLAALGIEGSLARGAGVVVRIFALGLTFDILARAAGSFLEGLARPVPAMLVMWAANAVNLGLNLLLVPGSFGLPAFGAAGSAWATGGARLFLLVALLAYIWRMPDAAALGIRGPSPRDRPAEVLQRRIGYGAGASLFAESAAFSGMNIIAGWLGGLAVAGWAIVLNLSAVIFMPPLGLSAATAVLVARSWGARDRDGIVQSGVLGFLVCITVAVAASLGVLFAAPLIARGYATDPALAKLAAHALRLACLFFVFDALQVVAAMAVRAQGDVWVPTITHVASYGLVMLPLGWLLAHPLHMGLDGIVWAVVAASIMSSALLLGRFWMLTRRPL